MIVSKYGIRIRRIVEQDIEKIRQWRNSEHVRQYMEYREYISKEMQKKWFDSINNFDNFYFIIEYKGEEIGVINEKNVDRSGSGTSESGLFIADPKYRNTHIPVLASLVLIEGSMYMLFGKESYIHILRDNHEAIAYNTAMGYELCEGQMDVDNQLYCMTKESFERKTAKIRKAAQRLCEKEYPNGYVIFEPHDYETGLAQKFESYIPDHYPYAKSKQVSEGKLYYY